MGMRRVLALGLAMAPVVVVAVTWLLVGDRLPDPVPSHWNAGGEVDRTMSATGFAVMSLGLTGLVAALAVGVVRAHEDERVRRLAVLACAFSAYLIGGIAVMTLLLARDAATAQEVRLPWYAVTGAIAAALAVPALAALVWPPPAPAGRGPVDPALPRLDLAEGERAVYVTTVRSRGFVALGIGCVVVGVALMVFVNLLVGAAVIAVTVAALALSQVTVRVDETGLRLGFGPGVRVRVPLADIRQASAEEIRPLAWGGWGYRVLPGKRALVLRGGPGLVLDLRNGNRFAVTLDEPETPAALVNGLLDRRH